MTAQRPTPARRDALLLFLGCLGMGYQQVTHQYHVPLLVLYGLMVGIPGVAQLAQVLGSIFPGQAAGAPTPQEPSSPAAAPSSTQQT